MFSVTTSLAFFDFFQPFSFSLPPFSHLGSDRTHLLAGFGPLPAQTLKQAHGQIRFFDSQILAHFVVKIVCGCHLSTSKATGRRVRC